MGFFSSRKTSDTDRSPGAQLKLPTIIASKVSALVTLDPAHYVFLLTFINDEKCVLKAEAQIDTKSKAITHDFGVRIMGHVSAVKAETLTPMEIQQIPLLTEGITKAFFTAERMVAGGTYSWVKAAFQENMAPLAGRAQTLKHNDATGFDDDDADTKLAAKANNVAVLKKLKGNSRAWKSMGEVLAADTFNGNSDRICLEWGTFTNLGNVIFRKSGKKIVEAIGLDTFDPSISAAEGDMTSSDIRQWQDMFGKFLKTPTLAADRCKACIAHGKKELNKVFDDPSLCKWGDKEARWLNEGFLSGTEKLKKKMSADAKRFAGPVNMMPKGIVARLKYLGWA